MDITNMPGPGGNPIEARGIRSESAPGSWLTISIGGTVSDGSAPLSALFDEADCRLYEVKNQGRNGVRVSSMLAA